MSDTIPSRYNWCLLPSLGSIVKDKNALINSYINYMLIRTNMIFEYEGLPDTIPKKDLELYLQIYGNCTITKVDGKLYAFYSGLGGVLNEYYHPTISTISNPYLKFTANLEIGKSCEVILNDVLYQGLYPLFERYASLLAENDLSIRMALILARAPYLATADNENAIESAKQYFKDIEDGKLSGLIASDSFFEGVRTSEYASKNTHIKELLEMRQYLISQWFIELGLNSNFNMKREALNDSETTMNDNILIPLIDDMLQQRIEGVERVNKLYGTNISVKKSSAWEMVQKDIETTPEESKEGEEDETTTNDN